MKELRLQGLSTVVPGSREPSIAFELGELSIQPHLMKITQVNCVGATSCWLPGLLKVPCLSPGVATFCKDSATPVAAEEGLSGLLATQNGDVGCYGNMDEFTQEELRALDSEGRALLTQHKIR